MTSRPLLVMAAALGGGLFACGESDKLSTETSCDGTSLLISGQPACVSMTGAAAAKCPPEAPMISSWGPFQLCGASTIDEASLRELIEQEICGADAAAVLIEDVAACLYPAIKSDDGCPELMPFSYEQEGISVCASGAELQAGDLESLVTEGCQGGTVVVRAGATACVFITETGFSCPPFLVGASQVGDWTVCGQDDSAEARWVASDSCGADGYLATSQDGNSGCVFITETGFSCPPHAMQRGDFGDTGVCGGPQLSELQALAIGSAYCGEDAQMVSTGGRGLCAYFITETGFRPCPSTHPIRRAAAPFDTCATAPLPAALIAQARQHVCGPSGSGAYIDIGADPLCGYAITETGFDCPPLLPSTFDAAGAPVCGRTADVPQASITAAGAFAATPSLCPWTSGLTSSFNYALGGVQTTVRGVVMTGSYRQFGEIVFPGGISLDATKAAGHFVADLNLNGSIAQVDVLATSDVHDLVACGHASLPDGSSVLAGVGFGLVDFANGDAADLGDNAVYIIRLDPYGVVQSTATAPLNLEYDRVSCAVAATEGGDVMMVTSDDFSSTPSGWVFRFDGADALVGNAAITHHIDGIAGHASGFTVAGGYVEPLSLVAAEGGSIVVDEGGSDADVTGFVARMDANGAALWARTVKGSSESRAWAVSQGPDGGVVVVGYVLGGATVTDPVSGVALATAEDTEPQASLNTFILRLDADGQVAWLTTAKGTGNDEGHAVTVGLDGAVHVGGRFVAALTYGEGANAQTISNASAPTLYFYSGYVAKFDVTDGSPLALTPTSADEPTLEPRGAVMGHLDGSTTHAGTFLGEGRFGVPGSEVTLDKGALNSGVYLVYTGAESEACTTIAP